LFDVKDTLPVAHFESFGSRAGGWRASLYSPRTILTAHELGEVIPLLREAEREGRRSWVAVAISYDAAPAFDRSCRARPSNEFPLAWAAVFDSDSSAPEPASVEPFSISPWMPGVSKKDYGDSVRRIRDYIEKGDVYQVNYTFPLTADFHGDAWSCYSSLGQQQKAGYSAYLEIGHYRILSFSPELLIERSGRTLRTRPMKGTARRGRWLEEDDEAAAQLRASVKNRAENAMIVDLMRNDLSRVAKVGTVSVPEMFHVEPYGQVLQMTSTVQAELESGCDFVDTMKAIFPSGSITGAPKYSSMSIIHELEPNPRGLYTGAIGYIRPGGDFILNVAIRTMVIDTTSGRAAFGVGGGITWDSTVEGEYEEALLKAEFLSVTETQFDLLETVRLEDGEFDLLARHLARMEESARYYGFAWDARRVRSELASLSASCPSGAWRVRITSSRDGTVRATAHPMPEDMRPCRVSFALSPIDRNDSRLFHKTTDRRVYEDALSAVVGADDVVLWNTDGEVTESTIANVVVEIDGQLCTPPRTSGLLAGTLRGELVDQGIVVERVISKAELTAARSFFLINSLRGWMRAELVETDLRESLTRA
jgi:para-aminobenzoate synthetase/4-amino-4-deoxychorismate lyase